MTQETRDSLLIRIRDPDDVRAWQQFVEVYRPMIYRIARRRALQHCDAEDLTQKVLMSVARAMPAWRKDPQRGSFRAWLNRVARNAIINFVSRSPRDVSLGGTDFLDVCLAVQSPDGGVQRMIDEEFARSQLRAAADIVRASVQPKTWDAFWLSTVEGQSVEEVSTQLKLSPGAIYGARARVMKQLHAAAESMVVEDASAEESSS